MEPGTFVCQYNIVLRNTGRTIVGVPQHIPYTYTGYILLFAFRVQAQYCGLVASKNYRRKMILIFYQGANVQKPPLLGDENRSLSAPSLNRMARFRFPCQKNKTFTSRDFTYPLRPMCSYKQLLAILLDEVITYFIIGKQRSEAGCCIVNRNI